MISNEFLNQRYGSSRHKSTEESSDADSVKMVKDYKGQDYGRCQTGEIKGCLDLVILFMQKFRQIPRKNIGRDNRQQAVVGEADAKTHQKKTCEKIQNIQRLCIWQMLNPEIVYINHFTEPNANYKGKQVACTKGTFQNHQSNHKQCLENIIPCSETEHREGDVKYKRH